MARKRKAVPKAQARSGKPVSIAGRMGFGARLRAYFLAGILVTAPIGITLYLSWLFVTFIDDRVASLLPPRFNPETYLPFSVPGLGVVTVVVLLILVGSITAGLLGRTLLRMSEGIVNRIPAVRHVYAATKQILETVLANQSKAFREVVLFEYPRRGIWAIGFITGPTEGEVQNLSEDTLINIFVPTTPNPTSGFLLFVPEERSDRAQHEHRGRDQDGRLRRHPNAAGQSPRRDREARSDRFGLGRWRRRNPGRSASRTRAAHRPFNMSPRGPEFLST